jgi:hypothetical protein
MRVLGLLVMLLIGSSGNAFADVEVKTSGNSSVSVKQEVKGTTTTCINGKCETTGGGGKSTVCVNGKCYESTDGNIDINENGAQVQIKNSNGENSVSVKSTGANSSVKVESNTSGSGETKSTKSAEIKEQVRQQQEKTKRFIDTFLELLKNLLPFF